jgi:hypothetical protein
MKRFHFNHQNNAQHSSRQGGRLACEKLPASQGRASGHPK